MRLAYRLSIVAALLLGAVGSQSVHAQYDGYEEGGPGPRGGSYGYRYGERRASPPRRLSGLNCDALQPGLLGPQPFSCPLPGPRPLGARCFCDTPVAPLSGGDTVAGRVVP